MICVGAREERRGEGDDDFFFPSMDFARYYFFTLVYLSLRDDMNLLISSTFGDYKKNFHWLTSHFRP